MNIHSFSTEAEVAAAVDQLTAEAHEDRRTLARLATRAALDQVTVDLLVHVHAVEVLQTIQDQAQIRHLMILKLKLLIGMGKIQLIKNIF